MNGPTPADAAPPVILVVDDDHAVRVRLRALFESAGYVVFTATDGLMALALLRRLPELPRLVFLDLVMPIMDGWEFLEAKLAEPRWSQLPIVLHTSAADDCLPLGVPRLGKPASDADILAAARSACA